MPSARLEVKVVPRASKTEIVGWLGAALKVRVAAVPEKGRANAELEVCLARALGVPVRDVRVVAGHGARSKLVAVDGLDADALRRRLPMR